MKEVLDNGKFSKLFSDEGEAGWSGEVHLVIHNGKKYVVRKCKTLKRAKYFEGISQRLEKQGFLPKLFARVGKNLVYEYIGGRDLRKKEGRKIIIQVGRICAHINKIKAQGNGDKIFYRWLRKSRPVLTKKQYKESDILYSYFKRKLNPQIRMDAGDTNPDNFRLRKGKVYLVDIDSIWPLFKAYGIGKAFFKWFKKPNQRNWFKQGYGLVSSNKFITEEYEDFISLAYIIHELRSFAEYGKKYKPGIKARFEKLDELLNKYEDKVGVLWKFKHTK